MASVDLGGSVILRAVRAIGRVFRRDPTKSRKYALGETHRAFDGWARWHGAQPQHRGNPENSILAVPGLDAQPPIVRATLLDVADELGIPVDSLAVTIGHESGWKADAVNPLQAYGLIQLTAGARLPGFADAALMAVACMPAEDQLLRVVKPYYARFGAKTRGADPGLLAMLNFLPTHAGKGEDFVLARKGEDVYHANPFDPKGAKGFFTIGDVYAHFAATAAQAGNRRVAVDGRIIDGPALRSAALPAPTVVSKPAPKPAPKAWAPAPAPVRQEPSAPQFVSGTGWGAPPPELETAAPSQLMLGAGSPSAPRSDSPVVGAAPGLLGMGSATGGGMGMELRRSGDDEDPYGAQLSAQGVDDMRGLLLGAVRAGQHRPEAYMELEVPDMDLVVTILRDALQARVGSRWLRLGVSYSEQIEICRVLGLVSPTKEVVDAAWAAAKADGHAIAPEGLVQDPADFAKMATIEFAIAHNDRIERAIAKGGFGPDTFVRPYGKAWLIHPAMVEADKDGVYRGVVEYGWQQLSGKPIQGPGSGRHDANYADYSMVTADLVMRRARRISTGETVDVLDRLREIYPGDRMAAAIEAYR